MALSRISSRASSAYCPGLTPCYSRPAHGPPIYPHTSQTPPFFSPPPTTDAPRALAVLANLAGSSASATAPVLGTSSAVSEGGFFSVLCVERAGGGGWRGQGGGGLSRAACTPGGGPLGVQLRLPPPFAVPPHPGAPWEGLPGGSSPCAPHQWPPHLGQQAGVAGTLFCKRTTPTPHSPPHLTPPPQPPHPRPLPTPPQIRFKTDAKAHADKKKVQPLSFGIVTRVKDGVAFARDLGFASFGELVIFVPSPARLKSLQASGRCVPDPGRQGKGFTPRGGAINDPPPYSPSLPALPPSLTPTPHPSPPTPLFFNTPTRRQQRELRGWHDCGSGEGADVRDHPG